MTIHKAFTMRASSIGDCLMGKYLLEQVHAQYPEAECSIIVASRADMIRDLLAAYPWISVYEASRRNLRGLWKAARAVWGSDATVTQYSGRGAFSTGSKIFARLFTRRGRLAGFADTWPLNSKIYDHLIPFDLRRALRLHECDALEALDISASIQEITLVPTRENKILEKLDLTPNSYVVLNLFSGSKTRGLSFEHQRAIAQTLQETLGTHTKIILTGGPSDKPLASSLKEAIPELIVAIGLPMQDLITLVARSMAVVSLDTGVGHIAAQTGVPLVIMRTCWGYNWWNKDQYPRSGITVLSHDELCKSGHIAKDFPACLSAISPEEIIEAFKKLIT